MPRPDAVRRIKTYSAANGYVYQYYFFEVNRLQLEGITIGEFIYLISADRHTSFPLKIYIKQSALDTWARQNGRVLTSSEEYALAKMRLFQAFDEGSVPTSPQSSPALPLLVDETNLEALLRELNI